MLLHKVFLQSTEEQSQLQDIHTLKWICIKWGDGVCTETSLAFEKSANSLEGPEKTSPNLPASLSSISFSSTSYSPAILLLKIP